MSTNYELMDIAESYGVNGINIIMNDELQNYEYKTSYFILNLEDSTDIGSHWVSLIIEDGRALYCDSFGLVPSLEVENWIHKNTNLKYVWNNNIFQDIKSTYCGFFALSHIIYIQKTNKNLFEATNDFINLFNNNNNELNDTILMELFNSGFENI